MAVTEMQLGLAELRKARRESRVLYWFVAIFSIAVNMLMLTGPIYMLQVYDRVLGSRSVATLIALTLIVAFLYGMMGLLDYVRGRVMGRVAARFQAALDVRVFDAVVRRSATKPDQLAQSGLRDLESVQRLMSSPVLMSIFDMPAAPFFILGIWFFHPWLAALAVLGGVILIVITVFNQIVTKNPTLRSNIVQAQSSQIAEQIRSEAEMVQAMGMRQQAFARWHKARSMSLR
ncbi:MAG: ABC transporter transmembrane domain-containing protein, partial [Paracoccaceae bacterium]